MRLFGNILTISVILAFGIVSPAYAADGISNAILNNEGLAALAIAIAAFGGALGQSKVMSSALESIGRNPGAAGQMFVPWILGVAFIESLVVFALIVALKVVGFI